MGLSPPSSLAALVVGRGINAVAGAALPARRGRRVSVIERAPTLGVCIRTRPLTHPGFLHATLSTAHPLFPVGPAYTEIGPALHDAALEDGNADRATGVLMPDGRATSCCAPSASTSIWSEAIGYPGLGAGSGFHAAKALGAA